MFQKIDFLSTKPQIFTNGKNRFSTIFGIIFSIVTMAVIVTFAIYFLNEMFQRQTINIYSYSYINSLPSINMSNFPLMISIQNGNGIPYPEEERLFRIYGVHCDFSNYSNVKYIPIYPEKCDIDKHFGEYKEFFKDIPFF
jgi:hypothetical protein